MQGLDYGYEDYEIAGGIGDILTQRERCSTFFFLFSENPIHDIKINNSVEPESAFEVCR
jgi:hypothetical protein